MDDVILDPAAALARLGPLRSALAAHDWGAVGRVLEGATPVERTLVLLAAEPPDPEGFLGHVLGQAPADSTAAALLAQHRVATAWAVRGSGWSDQVSRAQFDVFVDGLRRAEWVLIEATARRPDDPTLWVERITTARGLELGVAESRRRYDRLAALDPQHLPGQQQLLQNLCPKWAGSWELAFGFARECVAASEAGSLTPVLVVEAHVEQLGDLQRDGSPDARDYLTRPDVRAEILDAAHRSVWHPAFVPVPGWVGVLTMFAFVFGRQGDQRAAADMFTRLGPLSSPSPWQYMSNDPAARVRQARAEAFGGGAR